MKRKERLNKIQLETTVHSGLLDMIRKLENYFGSKYEKYKAKVIKSEKDKLMQLMEAQK